MLTTYNRKRKFGETPEPEGKKEAGGKHRFVVQKHDASRLHYDFRLELDGVLKSWAVPKGPSMDPAEKRLAVQVEDHPVSYINFSGTIPKGNYGAGKVDVWDKGNFTPVDETGHELSERQALTQLKKGELKFELKGKQLKGGFVLVQLKNDPKNWLLIKHKDSSASKGKTMATSSKKKTTIEKTAVKKKAAPRKAAKKSTDEEKEKIVKLNGHEVKLTNPQKIYWPKEGITKGEMLAYYERMAPVILPYLKNRPLSLKRNPGGITDKGFFQKDADDNTPEWITTTKIFAESTQKIVRYIVCNDKATLLYLANLGCIEMNPWNSTIKDLDKPNYLILDIDPAEKSTFDQVVETAQVIGSILEKAGATSYCKTSGASGLHVYIPLGAKYSYEQARQFGELVASLAQQQLPSFTSLERNLSKRGQKIYIDYLQNSRGQTLASAYSLRPVPGAQVSTPLLWKEVKKGIRPSQFTIYNIEERVKKLGDVFYMVLKKGINLQQCLKKLG